MLGSNGSGGERVEGDDPNLGRPGEPTVAPAPEGKEPPPAPSPEVNPGQPLPTEGDTG